MTKVVSPIVTPTVEEVKPRETEGKIDVIIAEAPSDNIENLTPLDLYEKEHGHPYTVESLNIFFWDALNPEVDVHSVMPAVRKIEKYITGEIKENRLTPTVGSYKEIMQRIKDALDMSDNEMIESKIERVRMYVDLMNKQKARRKKDTQLQKVAQKLKIMFKR